ncbi:hypothetical protein Nepgr_021482 [Nepenthes gracilis]|uniref:Uncharacterized protein n=1 Tax=Nepenthes gracilis TaxID=150966 RepID=A0AAD3T111_NEPGR|nr:hypothetical protein Nepgr_021482 [Nepenthes gracilis]
MVDPLEAPSNLQNGDINPALQLILPHMSSLFCSAGHPPPLLKQKGMITQRLWKKTEPQTTRMQKPYLLERRMYLSRRPEKLRTWGHPPGTRGFNDCGTRTTSFLSSFPIQWALFSSLL